ncbi:DUF4246 family protein, partial [Staphylococcus aureus]
PKPSDKDTVIGEGSEYPRRQQRRPAFSNKFQWLPCDVELDPDTGAARIASYINNLHPREHARLYPIIEKFIETSLPA